MRLYSRVFVLERARRAGTLYGSEQIDGLTSGHHTATGDAFSTLRPLKEDAEQNGNRFSGGCISPRVAIFTMGWGAVYYCVILARPHGKAEQC